MQKLTWIFAPLLLAVGSCSSPTHYDLVSFSDRMRYLIPSGAAPAGWTDRAFDDTSWKVDQGTPISPIADGNIVCVRRKFDLGPEFSDYTKLTLKVATPGSWQAYLNGAPVASGSGGATPEPVVSTPGMLLPSGNLLAVEVHPAPGVTALAIQPTLDGATTFAPGGASQVVRGPWLVAPALDSITIVWETSAAVASKAVVDGRDFDGASGTHHVARVTGLLPSHSYGYHVEAGDARSEDSTLQTAARPGERVRFVVYGDNRTDGDAHRRVVEAIALEGPDFLVNTGDLVDASNDSEWQSFFNLEYGLIRHVPLYPAIGNHESDSGGAGRMGELFPVGDKVNWGGQVYSFDYGDVHIAVLNSNGGLDAQARWLDSDLSAADARGARHEFVVMHWGPYSSGTTINHGVNDDAKAFISPVAKAHRADAIFAGHDHFYERGASDGLAYFVTGGGGAPLTSAGRIAETLVSSSVHHYLVVDVSGATAAVTARDLSGGTFDQVTLTR